jgi:hypothetical protein
MEMTSADRNKRMDTLERRWIWLDRTVVRARAALASEGNGHQETNLMTTRVARVEQLKQRIMRKIEMLEES